MFKETLQEYYLFSMNLFGGNCNEALFGKGESLRMSKDFEVSIQCYDLALKKNFNYLPAINGKGKSLQEIKQYGESLKCFQKAYSIDSKSYIALIGIGDCLISEYNDTLRLLQRQQESIEFYDKAIEFDGSNIQALRGKVDCLKQLKRQDELQKTYDKILQMNPQDVNALIGKVDHLINFIISENKYSQLIEYYKKIINIDPKNSYIEKSILQTADQLLKWGRHENSISCCILVLQVNPKNALALYFLLQIADYLKDQYKLKESQRCYDLVLQFDSQNITAYLEKAELLKKRGSYQELVEFCKNDSQPIHPSNYFSSTTKLVEIGQHFSQISSQPLKRLKQILRIIKCYDIVLYIDQKNKPAFEAIISIGDQLKKLNKLEESIECFNRVILIDSVNFQALFGKADCLVQNICNFDKTLGEYEQSLELYHKVLDANPKSLQKFQILSDIADILHSQKLYEKSLSYLDRQLLMDPQNLKALLKKGECLKLLQKNEQSLESYRQVLLIDSKCITALFGYSECLINLNQYKESYEYYEKAVQSNPTNNDELINKTNQLIYYLNNLNTRQQLLNFPAEAQEMYLNKSSTLTVLLDIGMHEQKFKGNQLQRLEQYQISFKCYDMILQIEPQNGVAVDELLKIANCLKSQEKYEESLRFYGRIILTNLLNIQILLDYAQVLQIMARYMESFKYYDKVIELDAKNIQAIEGLSFIADTLKNMGKYKESIVCYNRILSISQNNKGALTGRGTKIIQLAFCLKTLNLLN